MTQGFAPWKLLVVVLPGFVSRSGTLAGNPRFGLSSTLCW